MTGRATKTNCSDPHHREGDAAATARRPRPATRCATRRWPARLRRIGREGREAFYEGAVARDIVNRLKELGGLHEEEDFAAQRSQWVEPIHASYRGYDVYECPPANQGLTALMILKTLEGYALGGDAFSEADRLHLIAEATKAAYHIRDTSIGDPDFVAGRCRDLPVRGMGRARPAARSGSTAPCRRGTGRGSSTRTRSTCASSIATATRCRSSTRCSRRSAPASWGRKAASSCTIAAAASALDPRPSERDRAAEAPVPHADPRHAGQGRHRGDAVRRDGRAVSGGRPRDLSALFPRPRHGPAAGRRGAARLRLSGRLADRAFRARSRCAPTSRGAATKSRCSTCRSAAVRRSGSTATAAS